MSVQVTITPPAQAKMEKLNPSTREEVYYFLVQVGEGRIRLRENEARWYCIPTRDDAVAAAKLDTCNPSKILCCDLKSRRIN